MAHSTNNNTREYGRLVIYLLIPKQAKVSAQIHMIAAWNHKNFLMAYDKEYSFPGDYTLV